MMGTTTVVVSYCEDRPLIVRSRRTPLLMASLSQPMVRDPASDDGMCIDTRGILHRVGNACAGSPAMWQKVIRIAPLNIKDLVPPPERLQPSTVEPRPTPPASVPESATMWK